VLIAVIFAFRFPLMYYTGLGVMTCVVHRQLVGAVHFSLWPNTALMCVVMASVDECVHSELV
jgi:hypothetical protein